MLPVQEQTTSAALNKGVKQFSEIEEHFGGMVDPPNADPSVS
jgi:hypothetical protein